MRPVPSGWSTVNPDSHHIIRIYCEDASPHHDKNGRTWLLTLARGHRDAHWHEVNVRSSSTARRYEEQLKEWSERDDLPVYDAEAGEYVGTYEHRDDDLRHDDGFRPNGVTYLHGDTPVPAEDQHFVREALTFGTRSGARGTEPAREADLTGRAKIDRKCKCGRRLRLRLEQVEPVLDRLAEAGEDKIEAAALRRLVGRV